MSFKEELSSLYQAADNTAEALKACDEFIKPKLIEAAKSRKDYVIIASSQLPDVVQQNRPALYAWVKQNSLELFTTGNGNYYFAGWSKQPRLEDDVGYQLLSWIFR
jgi:hypothetical protein